MTSLKIIYLKLKIRHKILTIGLISGFFPLLALSLFAFMQLQDILRTREKEVLNETLNQSVLHLDYKLTSYETIFNNILWDYNLNNQMNTDFNTNYDMYLFYRDTLNPLFYNALSLNRDLTSLTLYTNQNINPHGNFLLPLDEIENDSWYREVLNSTSPLFHTSGDNSALTLSGLFASSLTMASDGSTTTLLSLSVDYLSLFYPLNNLFEEDYGIIINDTNNNIVYNYSNYENNFNTDLSSNALNDSDYFYDSFGIATTDWTIYLFRPVTVLSQSMNNIIRVFLIVCLLSLVLLFMLVYYFSRKIIHPLESLTNNMKTIDSDNFLITVETNSDDEIKTLIGIFTKMVKRIENLINEVYKTKISKQEYEIKALQSQINPHFFYNALSLINSKAILSNQEDISQMTQYLSTFYRTTLNRGKSSITIKEEISNVESYLKIQQMMHDFSFDFFIKVSDTLKDYKMPNLILQPIVENAIHHGIDHITTQKRGIITIDGEIEADSIVFTVSDNGQGMTDKDVEVILSTKGKGYGVKNVHNRLELIYGPEYGLQFESYAGLGTEVSIRIPIQE